MKRTRKITAILIAVMMLTVFVPTTALAAVDIGVPSSTHPAVNVTSTGDTGRVYYGGSLYRVVENDGTTMTLFMNGDLGTNIRYDATGHQRWSGSDIAGYLNTSFLYLFSTTEQSTIARYGTTEEANPLRSIFTEIDISQKIVLPSVEEVSDISDGGTWGMTETDRANRGTWWLRSPGGESTWAAFVNIYGYVNGLGNVATPVNSSFAVRPAFKINLSSVIFTSAAAGGKPGTAGSDLAAATPPTGAVKLTVKDSALTVGTIALTSVSGRTVAFNYTGATSDETLSAVVKNSAGEVKYYGKLEANTNASGSGTSSVTMPDDFASTDSLEIFVEEINLDYLTDFASDSKSITIANQTAPITPVGGENIITGVDDTMEYSSNGGITWIPVTATEIPGLPAGDYEVRYKDNVNGLTVNIENQAKVVTVSDPNPAPLNYNVLGDFGKYTGSEIISGTVDADANEFVRLTLNGKEVDSANYVKKSGSTIITLNESYLKTFKDGTYNFSAEFTNGYADLTLVVALNVVALNNEAGAPYTGDEAPLGILISLIVLSGAIILFRRKIVRY